MKRLALLLTLMAPALGAQGTLQVRDDLTFSVRMEIGTGDEEGEVLLSVRATDTRAEDLVGAIAQQLRISRVEGFEFVQGDPRVTVNLERRPAGQALRWILGSVGLVATVGEDSISVTPDVGPRPDGRSMLLKASARYFDALRRFPDYPAADGAQMARAEVTEQLGPDHWGAAVLAYDQLIDEFPRSEHVPDAALRSARLQGQLGNWSQAALRFEELSRHWADHPYHAIARAELADALCRSGEVTTDPVVAAGLGEKARNVLDALDSTYPTQVQEERYERLLTRARAHALTGNAIRALQSLDAAARYGQAGTRDPRVLELKARALGRAGEHAAASSAWLAWAEEVEGDARRDGYGHAARAALDSGEELAVLMIHARAEELGFGDALAGAASEARARLGLADSAVAGVDAAANLARGEAHVDARRWDAASAVLQGAYRDRAVLDRPQRVRLAKAYALSLQRTGHAEAAIDVVRAIVRDLDKEAYRRELYLLAADLYETRENPRYDLAIEALKGRL